ncbi:MAG TPA: ATPase [Epulopiscium sp.]|nr:ATPase [Candidatus Epulonipiscium sp.]
MEENPRINEINAMLDLLEDVLEDSKQAFLSARVMVDKEEIFDIIKDIRLRLPNEIQQSRWVVEDRTKILAKAQAEADLIIEEAHETVDRMVRDHEITQYAQEQAQGIINAARNDAREMQLGAVEYVDSVMKDLEHQLKDTLDVVYKEASEFQAQMGEVVRTVYANRKELKGVIRTVPTVPTEEYEEYEED